MRRILIILLFICAAENAFSQTKGEVTVTKDPLIDSLIAQRLRAAKSTTPVTVPAVKPTATVVNQFGYRVQISYGSDRKEIFGQQTRFRGMYPKHNSYISYKAPNYYLRVGDFRTRLEAQALMNELKPLFPTLFIFREKINAPELD